MHNVSTFRCSDVVHAQRFGVVTVRHYNVPPLQRSAATTFRRSNVPPLGAVPTAECCNAIPLCRGVLPAALDLSADFQPRRPARAQSTTHFAPLVSRAGPDGTSGWGGGGLRYTSRWVARANTALAAMAADPREGSGHAGLLRLRSPILGGALLVSVAPSLV